MWQERNRVKGVKYSGTDLLLGGFFFHLFHYTLIKSFEKDLPGKNIIY